MTYDKKETSDKKITSEFEYEYKEDYLSDWEIHKDYIQGFDPLEAMLLGKVYDSVSGSIDGSKITDSYAMTLAKEAADREIAKTPEGETESAGKADMGKAAFMDIVRQKWIYPNANSQRPFKEKLNLWALYKRVYGYMPMFYDWNTSSTGYVGPDCWLWSPRNLVPQQGKVSIEDSEYVTALTWFSKKKLEAIRDGLKEDGEDGWDREALDLLISVANQTSTPDVDKDTFVTRERTPQEMKKGVCLATRYESGMDGRWCTFAPDNSYIKVRDIANPHKNGRIPFVINYSQPLFDSFYGLGDFQRAMPLQFARDGLTNFYFASLKRNLSPGIIANANGVLKHTLDVTSPNPVLYETIPNSIRPMPTNTAGLSTYQGAMSNLTGSLLSLYGTQNASIPGAESLNPSQGKTPAAIDMYSSKEATRDGAERRHSEAAIEQLTDGFFSLVANMGTETIPVSLFAKDIEEINKAGLTDVLGLFSGNFRPDATGTAGDLKIKPSALKGVEYRFNITPESTMKINKQRQLQEWEKMLDNIGKFQNMFKDDPNIVVEWGKIMETGETLSDIPGVSEFITVKDGPTQAERELQEQLQQMQEQMQQMQQEMQAKEQESEQAANAKTVNGAGMFHDADIGGVAEQISKL
jgi:hypothetical protein